MKLLHRTSLIYLLFSSLLLLAAGLMIYFMITRFMNEEITEKLLVNKERIAQQIEAGNPILQLPPVLEVEVVSEEVEKRLVVGNVTLYDPMEEDEELFREVISVEEIGGKKYRIVVRQVIPEPHDYWNSIGLAMLLVMLLLLGGLLLVNWRISRQIWAPFYENLAKIKAFSLETEQPLHLRTSKTTEFQELNAALEALTHKIRADYHALREFTENASHEMQTPLAVLHAQLESALQVPETSEKQLERLNSALNATRRLSRLNHSLLLLAKIENRQYQQLESLSLRAQLDQCLEQFGPLIEAKPLSLNPSFASDLVVQADPALLEMLLSNLIGNAVRHNIANGVLDISLQNKLLRISNTGPAVHAPPNQLFARFAKGDPSSPSHGLGLSIVQKICETYHWTVSYHIENNLHILELEFAIQNSSKFSL